MASPKLLLGGLVGVGSVSTAAVVAHKQGFFPSFSNQTQEAANTPNADLPPVEPNPVTDEKPNQKAVENWLTTNKKESENWEIKIKKNDQEPQDFKDSSISEDDLKGLKDYLSASERENFLKSLFSAVDQNTLTFEKTDNNWKHILTKENIEKWVNKTSEDKATLKVVESSGAEKQTFTDDESIAIFKAVYGKESLFINVNGATTDNKKTILFEKDREDWKHSKSEIDGWLTKQDGGNSRFTIQIKTTGNTGTDLENEKEENLIGLLSYLKGENKKDELFKFIKDSPKTSLTFKKENSGWEVIHNETTINNWVSNTAGDKTTLKRYKNSQEATITTDGEWKTFFDAIKNETKLTTRSDDTRTIIFEQIDSNWKHIKKAIEELISENSWKKEKIKVCSGNTSKDLDTAKDNDLIGFYSHLKTSKDSYGELKTSTTDVTFKKDSTANTWSKTSCS